MFAISGGIGDIKSLHNRILWYVIINTFLLLLSAQLLSPTRRIKYLSIICKLQMFNLKEESLELERIDAIAEQLVGWIWDEVVNPRGEYYSPVLEDVPDSPTS